MTQLLHSIEQARDAILKAEVAAFLHDLDKMDFASLGSHRRPGDERQDLLAAIPDAQFMTETTIRLPDRLAKAATVPASIGRLAAEGDCVGAGFSFHHEAEVPLPLTAWIVHRGGCGADGFDPALDRVTPAMVRAAERGTDSIDLSNPGGLITTPYGAPAGAVSHEWVADQRTVLALAARWLADPAGHRDATLHEMKEILSRYLGEPLWPSNDITLWAHSYSTASYAKAILAKAVIESAGEDDRGRHFDDDNPYCLPLRNPTVHDNAAAFSLLLVAFDRESVLTRVQTGADVAAVTNAVSRIKQRVRTLLEVDLPLGNAIYEDECRLLFLLPRLGSWPERISAGQEGLLEREIEERLRTEIAQSLREAQYEELRLALHWATPALEFYQRRRSYEHTDDFRWTVHVVNGLVAESAKLLNTGPSFAPVADVMMTLVDQHGGGDGTGPPPPICGRCGLRTCQENARVCGRCESQRRDGLAAPSQSASGRAQDLVQTSWFDETLEGGNNRLALLSVSFDLSHVFDGELFRSMHIADPLQLGRRGVRDWLGLCVKLSQGNAEAAPGPVRRIAELLPADVQATIRDATKENRLEKSDKGKIARALDRLLRRPDLYDERSFRPLRLSQEAKQLLEQGDPSSEERRRLNRVLLESVFPQEIAGSYFKNPSLARVRRSWETCQDFFRHVLVDRLGERPVFEITRSPVRWELIVPAGAADVVIDGVVDGYQDWFGRVALSLPLSIGAIFFHGWPGLALAMEARHRLARLLEPRELAAAVRKCKPDGESVRLDLEWPGVGDEGDCALSPLFCLPVKRADGQPDTFYPNVNVKPQGGAIDFWDAAGRRAFVRPWNVQPRETLAARLGRLDFLHLDGPGDLNDLLGSTRCHSVLGERSAYPVVAWYQFRRIRELLAKAALPDRQIRWIEGLLAAKRREWRLTNWRDDQTARSFCEAVLFHQNAFGPALENRGDQRLLLAAAQNGLLLDAINLFTRLCEKLPKEN